MWALDATVIVAAQLKRKSVRHTTQSMLNEKQTMWLLETLCVDFGFCLPPDAYEAIRSDPPHDIESFATAVIEAEGLDPQMLDRQLHGQVREVIAAAFQRAETSNGA